MANTKTLKQSFAGGEISPEMLGRIEDAGYQSGLALCRNFMVRPQGSAENRPGFQFVREVKDSQAKVRLIPFTYSVTQTMVIEFGHEYCRFHSNGGTLLDGDLPYEIKTPYKADDLFDVHYVQSADVMTLVHPDYEPMELRRHNLLDWRLIKIDFKPAIEPPKAPTGTADKSGDRGNNSPVYSDYLYVVTSIAEDGVSESEQSSVVTVSNNLYTTGNKNIIKWSAVPKASRYKVYRKSGGIYGYIGQTSETSFIDDNINPDLSVTPPTYDDLFATGGISSVGVADGGSGYVNKGKLASVSVLDGGVSYFDNGTLTRRTGEVFSGSRNSQYRFDLLDDTGTGGKLEIRVSKGVITSVKVIDAGNNYTNPRIVLMQNSVNGYVDNGHNIAKRQASFDFKVSSSNVLKISDATGIGAELQPIIVDNKLASIRVVSQGYGYTNPKITLESNVGSGAVIGAVQLQGNDYPSAVSYFQQRRVFGGTKAKPQSVWMTKSGTESNMSYSIPSRADDRISFRIAAREAGMISHIVPLSKLVLLSNSAEWNVGTVNSEALTPDSISVSPQSYIGASSVQPVIVNNALVYAAARGGHIRELAYNWQANGYVTGDLSIRATHLFDRRKVIDMALCKAPYPVVWIVSDSGSLLGCTYLPEQQIGAWHQHTTDGEFESCACVSEGDEDILYCVIRRYINNKYVRYIERMTSRSFSSLSDAFFVDCGLTYRGDETDTIKGLEHLEGKTVSILADGAVMPSQVVANGTVTMQEKAQIVHVGLPISADVQTLPMAMAVDQAYGQGRLKNINKVWLRVFRSSGIFAGQAEADLVEYKQRKLEPLGDAPTLQSDELEIVLKPQWSSGGQIFIRQIHPLPLTLLSITAEVAIGG